MGLDNIHEYVPNLSFLTDYISQEMIFIIGPPLFLFGLGIYLAIMFGKMRV